MRREPPASVKKILRRETNFGCPVPSCGNPFLTWHHFDPPWHVRNHHEPGGMIALCTMHHPMADSGVFSSEQIRQFKTNPNSIETIKARFEWLPAHSIIRIGGCYATDWCKISLAGYPLLEILIDEFGQTTINFTIKDSNNNTLVSMTENIFSIESTSIRDFVINASGNIIKVWTEEFVVGFECDFRRVSPHELETIILTDYPTLPNFVDPPTKIEDLDAFYEELRQINTFMPDIAAIGFRRNDPSGTIIRWHASRHLGMDGRIPLINFRKCRFHHANRTVELGQGKLVSGNFHLEFCSGRTFAF